MSRLVERARTFIGVKYRHRGRTVKGLDCAGLPWLSYAEEGVILPDLKKYGRSPFDDGLMRAATDALGRPIWAGCIGKICDRSILQTGDIVLVRFVREPHHMAIVGDLDPHGIYGGGLSLIHADGRLDVSRVVEEPLSDDYLKMIAAVFRRPIYSDEELLKGDYTKEDALAIMSLSYSAVRTI